MGDDEDRETILPFSSVTRLPFSEHSSTTFEMLLQTPGDSVPLRSQIAE